MSYLVQRRVTSADATVPATSLSSARFMAGLGQAISASLGLLLAIVGVIAVYRSRLDGSLNVPVVRASYFNLSAMLGLTVLALGLALILSAARFQTRNVTAIVGVIMVVGGVVLGAAGRTILRDVGAPRATGWAIMSGGIVALVAWSLVEAARRNVLLGDARSLPVR